jgi:hypothetical protein
MTHTKRFPRKVEGSSYPRWEEIVLSDKEEKGVEEKARQENIRLFAECMYDAQVLLSKKEQASNTAVVRVAQSLFEKRASHVVFWKDTLCKEKFDKVSL